MVVIHTREFPNKNERFTCPTTVSSQLLKIIDKAPLMNSHPQIIVDTLKHFNVGVKEYCSLNADTTADPREELICSCFSTWVMDLRSATHGVY